MKINFNSSLSTCPTYSGVSLSGLLVGVHGEEDQLAAVLLQPLHVGLQALNGLVSATVVNGNADRPRETLVQTCSLLKNINKYLTKIEVKISLAINLFKVKEISYHKDTIGLYTFILFNNNLARNYFKFFK